MNKDQDLLNNAVSKMRSDRLKTSNQWTLGELIVALDMIENRSLPVYLDRFEIPTHFISWRGSYDELAIEFDETSLPLTVEQFLSKCKSVLDGEVFVGYKGGEFTMGRRTPVWVDHYGEGIHRGVIGIKIQEDRIIIDTDECEY
jgi:hypothetical protein